MQRDMLRAELSKSVEHKKKTDQYSMEAKQHAQRVMHYVYLYVCVYVHVCVCGVHIFVDFVVYPLPTKIYLSKLSYTYVA